MGPLPAITGFITPITRVIRTVCHLFSAIYRGELTPFITASGAHLVEINGFLKNPACSVGPLFGSFEVSVSKTKSERFRPLDNFLGQVMEVCGRMGFFRMKFFPGNFIIFGGGGFFKGYTIPTLNTHLEPPQTSQRKTAAFWGPGVHVSGSPFLTTFRWYIFRFQPLVLLGMFFSKAAVHQL